MVEHKDTRYAGSVAAQSISAIGLDGPLGLWGARRRRRTSIDMKTLLAIFALLVLHVSFGMSLTTMSKEDMRKTNCSQGRPCVYDRYPSDGRLEAAIGDKIYVQIYATAHDWPPPNSRWRFLNAAGNVENLPSDEIHYNCKRSPDEFYFSLEFEMASEEFYGNYSVTVSNRFGSATETFQILPPDPEPKLTSQHFNRHRSIVVENNIVSTATKSKILPPVKEQVLQKRINRVIGERDYRINTRINGSQSSQYKEPLKKLQQQKKLQKQYNSNGAEFDKSLEDNRYPFRNITAIISTPGIQRKYPEESCSFKWNVTLPITHYAVYNFTTGINLPLSSNANYSMDKETGVITLTIWNIQMWDAGNYSLSVTVGNETYTDTGALLFVFGSVKMFINQTSNPIPATEGERVELTCTVISTSLPVAYRPKIYYYWAVPKFGFKNITDGPAISEDGLVITGYSFKDNGRILEIDSLQCPDLSFAFCCGQEEGSRGFLSGYCGEPDDWLYFFPAYDNFRCRPYTYPWIHEIYIGLGNIVDLQTYVVTNRLPSPKLTWSFVDASGYAKNLPRKAYMYNCKKYVFYEKRCHSFTAGLEFKLTSKKYYGNYSITVSNDIGSSTETIQVLPPDTKVPNKSSRILRQSRCDSGGITCIPKPRLRQQKQVDGAI